MNGASMTTADALMAARDHAGETSHYVVINMDGLRWIVEWECQECGERGSSAV